MNKTAVRACPIYENLETEMLNTQNFVLPERHPLSEGYDVLCCLKCGFVYADTSVTQNEYDLFYATHSKYDDNKASTGGGETLWDRRRFDETVNFISSFLPDKIGNLPYPILVTTLLHKKAIYKQIKSLSLPNIVNLLD